jgi:peroxiredoxin
LGQVGDRTEWQIVPRWTRGQELLYRGTVREQSTGGGVEFNNAWKLEARAFVLDMQNVDAQVAFLTKLTAQRPTNADKKDPHENTAVRLDVTGVDGLGRMSTAKGPAATIALDGPTSWEWGFIIPSPPGAVIAGQSWTTQDAGQPVCKYRLEGTEVVGSTTCLRVAMDQQSDDWDQPRGDSTGWKRQDTFWIMPRLGVAYRVKRTIQRREPAHREATYQLVTEFDMDSSLEYKGRFFEERRHEILETKQFEEERRGLLAKQQPSNSFDGLITQIDRFMAKAAPTPYREALMRVHDKAVANRNGVRDAPESPVHAQPQRLLVGKLAPDFAIQDFRKQETIGLRSWRGKPVLMVFYQPGGGTAGIVLRHIQKVAEHHPEITVVGFSLSDDAEAVKRLEEEMQLTFPTLPGRSLLQSYEVVATPRIVLLDGAGIVCGKYLGWGPEVSPALELELKKLHAPNKQGGQ